MDDPCRLVRETTAWVVGRAEHVAIDAAALDAFAAELAAEPDFDAELHLADPQYLLVVDTLNFCFWPDADIAGNGAPLEYADLARGIKQSVAEDPRCLDAARLASIDAEGVRRLVRWPRPLPLAERRAALLRETGAALLWLYGGSAAALVRAARGNAVALVHLVLEAMLGFRDTAEYAGKTIHFYKRAQIFAGDVHGAFGGAGLGALSGMEQLTAFADYRLPQLLRARGVLAYAPDLARRVDAREELDAGSPEEVEIRACTIAAVERLRAAVGARTGRDVPAFAMDWRLWEAGERARDALPPHHRVRTTFY